MSARSCDSRCPERRRRCSCRVGAVLIAAGRRSRRTARARPSTSDTARSGSDERAAHRIARHRHAAARAHAAGAAARWRLPMKLSTRRQNMRATMMMRTRSEDEAQPSSRAAAAAAAGPDAPTAGCRARASRPALPDCPVRCLITCCHASDAPCRSCLPNAFTMPTFSSVLACFGSILSERSNCSSALSGWFDVVVADAEVGADVRRRSATSFDRVVVPLDRVVVALGVEVEVAELDARRGVRWLALGDRLERVHLRLVEDGGTRRAGCRRRRRGRLLLHRRRRNGWRAPACCDPMIQPAMQPEHDSGDAERDRVRFHGDESRSYRSESTSSIRGPRSTGRRTARAR